MNIFQQIKDNSKWIYLVVTINLLIALLAINSLSQINKRNTSDKRIKQILINQEHKFAYAVSQQDIRVIKQMWADNSVMTLWYGKVLKGKKEIIEEHYNLPQLSTYDISDLQVMLYENAAVVIGKVRMKGALHSHIWNNTFCYTHVYILTGNKWKLIEEQMTKIYKENQE